MIDLFVFCFDSMFPLASTYCAVSLSVRPTTVLHNKQTGAIPSGVKQAFRPRARKAGSQCCQVPLRAASTNLCPGWTSQNGLTTGSALVRVSGHAPSIWGRHSFGRGHCLLGKGCRRPGKGQQSQYLLYITQRCNPTDRMVSRASYGV